MGGRSIPWAEIIPQLRASPGRWMLLPSMTTRPGQLVGKVNRRANRALRIEDGRVEAKPGWIGHTVEGRAICDVYLRFVPGRKPDAGDGQQDDRHAEQGALGEHPQGGA